MDERERVRRLSQALDRLIAGLDTTDYENLTGEYRRAFILAKYLYDLDFSKENRKKEALARHLLSIHPECGLRSDQHRPLLAGLREKVLSAWRWGLSVAALVFLVVLLNWALKTFSPQPAVSTNAPSNSSPGTDSFKVFSSDTQPPLQQPTPFGKVVYVSEGALWVKNFSEEQVIRLAEGGSQPRWSPSGRWVAFRHGDEQVWIADTQSDQRISLNDGQSVGRFAWKPGQDLLAYVAGDNEIRLYDPGLNEEFLLVPQVDNRKTLQLVWSPDGEYLAMHWFEQSAANSPYSAIWVITSRGDLQPGEIYNGDPELLGWSNDGNSLILWDGMLVGDGSAAFSASLRSDGLPLVRVPVETYQPEVLAEAVLLYEDYVRPDPGNADRLAIVVGGGRETWSGKVLYLSVEGKLEQLTSSNEVVTSPAWSPDGEMLAYVSMQNPTQELLAGGETTRQALMERRLFLLDLETRQARSLTNDPAFRDEYPLWSNDGNALLFVRLDAENRASLWLTSIDKAGPVQVVENLDIGGDWFGYYGHIEWGNYFDWWQEQPSSLSQLEPPPTPLEFTPPPPTSEKISAIMPDLRLGNGQIQRIALSPEGNLIAVGSSMGICVFDAYTWEENWCEQADPRPMGGVSSLEFDQHGTRIAAGTCSGLVTVWKAETGERLWKLDTDFVDIRCLAWSPNGERLIAGADDGWFAVLGGVSGEILKSLRAGWPSVLAAAWSLDGRYFATGDFFGETVIWEAHQYQRIAEYKSSEGWNINTLAWLSDNKTIAAGYAFEPGCGEGCNPDFGGQIDFLDASSGEMIRTIETGSPVKRLVLSPGGGTLAAGMWDALAPTEPGGAETWLINPQSGDLLTKLDGGRPDLGLDWFPSGDRLLIPGESWRIYIRSLSGESEEITLGGFDQLHKFALEPQGGFAWDPQADRIATSTSEGRIFLWEVISGLQIDSFNPGGETLLLAWSPDGNILAVSGTEVWIWDIQRNRLMTQISLPDEASPYDLEWSPDGSNLAASYGEGQLLI